MSFTEHMRNRIHQRAANNSRLKLEDLPPTVGPAPIADNILLGRNSEARPGDEPVADKLRDVNNPAAVNLPKWDNYLVNQALRTNIPSADNDVRRSQQEEQQWAMVQAVQHYMLHVGERLTQVDYGVAVSDVDIAARQFDHLLYLGLNGPMIDSIREQLETCVSELEVIRRRTEKEIAESPMKPAIDAGFRLSCSPHRYQQHLIKPIPDQEDAFWILASADGVTSYTYADQPWWSVIAINYQGDGERFASVAELVDLRIALENHETLKAPENNGETDPVMFASWQDVLAAEQRLTM
ncbi:hypothetical protein [Rhizobium sp. MHM7A]|uniref:hypothetical protein n=1 Tax=Rhizobium sp. MHM7A TaxID=2583233 RepID=UPI001106AD89|nr:hypothetical protein [Rhizobium sp. MHM7A]TLX17168.1 hypothetical protein FFR93_07615 [Rhizobium sp. MHM7A]